MYYIFRFVDIRYSYLKVPLAKIYHELVENTIITRVTINLNNLNSFVDSFAKASYPLVENLVKFLVAGIFLYYYEKMVHQLMPHNYYDTYLAQAMAEMPLLGIASFFGANLGIYFYDFFCN